MQLSCIWFTILHTSFMIGCVIFTSFTKMVDYLSGVALDVELRVGSSRCCLNDVLLRNLSTVLQKWHLASSASPQTKPHVSMPSLEEEQLSCLDVTRTGLVWFNVLHSWQFDLLNSLQPTNWFVKWCPHGVGVFALMVAWLPFCLPCSTFLKASCLSRARPLRLGDFV